MKPIASDWKPKSIERWIHAVPSSTSAMRVETDVGNGYLKALGNNEGPHALACELIGTQLADWLGLPTFDFAIVQVTESDELWFHSKSGQASPGPAFITREEQGQTWGGERWQLSKLVNPEDIVRLVIFDTWTRNRDRYSLRKQGNIVKPRINYGNVFFSTNAPKKKIQLIAMDHTHCFSDSGELTKKLRFDATMKDDKIYGLFPEFRGFVDQHPQTANKTVIRLKSVDKQFVSAIVKSIPKEWDVPKAASNALIDLIIGRAQYVAETIEEKLWPQHQLEFDVE